MSHLSTAAAGMRKPPHHCLCTPLPDRASTHPLATHSHALQASPTLAAGMATWSTPTPGATSVAQRERSIRATSLQTQRQTGVGMVSQASKSYQECVVDHLAFWGGVHTGMGQGQTSVPRTGWDVWSAMDYRCGPGMPVSAHQHPTTRTARLCGDGRPVAAGAAVAAA
eukprot:365389-Chlamydomonas_euryale.AAC.6